MRVAARMPEDVADMNDEAQVVRVDVLQEKRIAQLLVGEVRRVAEDAEGEGSGRRDRDGRKTAAMDENRDDADRRGDYDPKCAAHDAECTLCA